MVMGYLACITLAGRVMMDPMRTLTIPPTTVATPLDTKKSLLQKAGRSGQAAPVRVAFVQQGKGPETRPGPLANLVENHDALGLDLYLLLIAMASHTPYSIRRPAAVLARALAQEGKSPVGAATISKAWARLEDLRLIRRSRFSKLAEITLLREDGSGMNYIPAGECSPPERYIKLPFSYWYDEWNAKLSLPAKAVLLICLTFKDEFRLPVERGKEWYGVSADSIGRGLDDLRRRRLLLYTDRIKKAPLSPLGFTHDRWYSLQPPFGAPKVVRS